MDLVATPRLRYGLSEQIIASLREVVQRFPSVQQVLIFGSRATGEYQPSSDIDLAVVAPGMSERDFSLLWCALDDLPILFKLDVLHFEQVTNPGLRQSILREGLPL